MRFSLKRGIKKVSLLLITLSFCILSVLAVPFIDFTNPTPENATLTTNTSFEINVSITETNLDSLIYNWNRTNFTFYNNSLILMYDFDKGLELTSEDSSWDDNLISVFHLNSDLIDSKGNNDATTSASVICNENVGKFNGGCEFDGYKDNITIANEENFDFEYTDNLSICFWASFDTFAANKVHTPLSKLVNTGSAVPGWEIHTWDVSGTVGDAISLYLIEDWGASKCIFASAMGILAGTEGKWQHICISYNGSNSASGVKIYQNGISKTVTASPAGLCTIPPSGSIKNNVPLLIGERENGGNTLDGKIDEVAIWNRTITPSEVQEIYIKGLVEDKSKYSNNGTIASTTNTTGKYSNAFEFNGVNDYIEVTPFDMPETNFAISLWFKTSDADTGILDASQSANWGYHDRNIYLENGNLKFRLWSEETISTTNTYNNNQWHQLIATVDENGMKLYVDGIINATGSKTSSDASASNNILIGYGGYPANNIYFNGSMDEFRIWNRSLSADEVYQSYISNLNKFNQTDWQFYANQSKNPTDGLDIGTYTYQIFTANSSGILNQTDLRTITITADATFPQLNFTSPTPANATQTTDTSIEINVSIIEENLNKLIYNWNNTNYTIYNDSLVLMMNFDNISSLGENDTYVVDLSDNGNNGTVFGAIYNSSGKYGGTYNFDGINDIINISHSASLNLSSAFTYSIWFNAKKLSGAELFSKGSSDLTDSPRLYIADSIVYFDISTGAGDTYSQTSSFTFSTDTWYNIIITGVAGSQPIIYVDSIAAAAYSHHDALQNPIFTNTEPLEIGGSSWVSRYFNGSIDEFRIWNRALSADEVYQQYISNLNKFNQTDWQFYTNQSKNTTDSLDIGNYTYQVSATDTSDNINKTDLRTIALVADLTPPKIEFLSPTPNNATSTTNTSIEINLSIIEPNLKSLIYNWNSTNYTIYDDSLTLMYNFDDYTVLNDTSKYGNNGTSANGLAYTSSGKYGGAYDFDGIDDYINIPDATTLDISQKTTFTAWIYPRSYGDSGDAYIKNIYSDEIITSTAIWRLGSQGSEALKDKFGVNYNDGDNHDIESTGTIPLNTWTHIVAVTDGTNIHFYFNGALDSSKAYSITPSQTSNNWWIGSKNTGGSPDRQFDGLIDEVRIWNRSLSANEVYQEYISNLNKFNSTDWNLYINQSKNSTDGLDPLTYTYQTFATDNLGNTNQTDLRTIIFSPSSGCPSSPQNWAVTMADNLEIDSQCNLTGHNITFSSSGNFTVNHNLYVNEIQGLSSGMTIYIKPNGIIYQGAL